MPYPKIEYKRRILSLAGEGDIPALLTASRDQVLQVFERIGTRWDVSYATGKWTARQIVAALTAEEWTRPAFHPERGPEPVQELLRMLAGHDSESSRPTHADCRVIVASD